MQINFLMTSHRQLEELRLAKAFFDRVPAVRQSTLLVHCNNADIPEENVRALVDSLPFQNRKLVYSPSANEGGYRYGQFEAICQIWEQISSLEDDAWWVHIHPDVFVVDYSLLLAAVSRADASGKRLVTTKVFGARHHSYATDFFAFRPTIPISIFESYRDFLASDVVLPLEELFWIEVHRRKVSHLVCDRFGMGQYHRDLDMIGMWHEHDLRRVKLYLKAPSLRWLPVLGRCAANPRRTLSSIRRFAHNYTHDQLLKRLSLI